MKILIMLIILSLNILAGTVFNDNNGSHGRVDYIKGSKCDYVYYIEGLSHRGDCKYCSEIKKKELSKIDELIKLQKQILNELKKK